jgi:predicted ATPase
VITRIEALNFRCLRHITQPIGPFHVLVGANASGKTTFLDVVALLGKLVADGLDAAVRERTDDFRDIVTGRQLGRVELAVEARIPEKLVVRHENATFDTVRYEVALGVGDANEEVQILSERLRFHLPPIAQETNAQRELFPMAPPPVETLFSPSAPSKTSSLRRVIVTKSKNDIFYPEPRSGTHQNTKTFNHSFRLGRHKSALGNLVEDEERFPVATWFKTLLVKGVQPFILNSLHLRKASPPNLGAGFRTDGSNLPWVVSKLRESNRARFDQWVEHVRTALPDVQDIDTVIRPDDRHRYLVINYASGLRVPAWMVSDGTLRLLALTLPAYLTDFGGVYLIEEPENGIHPRAVETVMQSLSSVYDAQVLVASHSPIVLGIVKPSQVLCFAKTPDGITDIVLGSEHPALREWRGRPDFSVLYASGVLG